MLIVLCFQDSRAHNLFGIAIETDSLITSGTYPLSLVLFAKSVVFLIPNSPFHPKLYHLCHNSIFLWCLFFFIAYTAALTSSNNIRGSDKLSLNFGISLLVSLYSMPTYSSHLCVCVKLFYIDFISCLQIYLYIHVN